MTLDDLEQPLKKAYEADYAADREYYLQSFDRWAAAFDAILTIEKLNDCILDLRKVEAKLMDENNELLCAIATYQDEIKELKACPTKPMN